jgi:hypothetical protein
MRSTITRSVLMAIASVVLLAAPAWAAAPGNDDVANPTPITSVPFSDQVDTSEATVTADDHPCRLNPEAGANVWYTLTLAQTTYIEINTAGSSYDTTLSASIETAGGRDMFACNDDSEYGLASKIEFEAQAGQTYLVMAGTYYGSAGGALVVNAFETEPPPPPYDLTNGSLTGSVNAKTGTVTLRGTVTCNSDGWFQTWGTLRQRIGRLILSTRYEVYGECIGGVGAWEAAGLQSPGGLFTSGSATVSQYTYGCNETSCDEDVRGDVVIKLKGR